MKNQLIINLFLLLLIISCKEKTNTKNSTIPIQKGDEKDSLYVTISPKILDNTNNKILLTLHNNTDTEIHCGDDYTLEFQENKRWKEIPFRKNVGFDDILHVIKPKKVLKFTVSIEGECKNCKDGNYRIVKEMSYFPKDTMIYSYFSLKRK